MSHVALYCMRMVSVQVLFFFFSLLMLFTFSISSHAFSQLTLLSIGTKFFIYIFSDSLLVIFSSFVLLIELCLPVSKIYSIPTEEKG